LYDDAGTCQGQSGKAVTTLVSFQVLSNYLTYTLTL
jgi:hypothetical protein